MHCVGCKLCRSGAGGREGHGNVGGNYGSIAVVILTITTAVVVASAMAVAAICGRKPHEVLDVLEVCCWPRPGGGLAMDNGKMQQ